MTTIRYSRGIVVARKIIAELNKILTTDQKQYSNIDSWSNCREQGFCIRYWGFDKKVKKVKCDKKVCIAEHRSSDDIVVIMGNAKDFDMQTNQPTEETYGGRKYFHYDDHKKAAEYIKAEMYEKVEKEAEKEKEVIA